MGWKKNFLLWAASALLFSGAAYANGKDKAPKIKELGKESAFVGQQLTVLGESGTDVVQLPANCVQPDPIERFFCPGPISGSAFGFVSTPGGFAFQIMGSNFDDNVVVWTDRKTQRFHFAAEGVDGSGRWGLVTGSVDTGDIADEAQDRGLLPGDFQGFQVVARGGNDQISADGRGAFGILPGHAVRRSKVRDPFFGERLMVDGGTGTNSLDLPPDCVDVAGRFDCFGPSWGKPTYGFVAVPGGFAFQIRGTDFDDEIVLWTNRLTGDFNFAIEWEDAMLTRKLRVGSVDAGDIADEAQDRGLLPRDFDGFLVNAGGGDDVIRADGRRLRKKIK